MKYMSVAETAKKWKLSERSIRNYCAEGKVEGAFLTGKTWNIPSDAKKPANSAKKEEVISPTDEVNELVAKAQVALKEFSRFTQEQIDYIVAKMSVSGLDHHGTLAQAAIEETKRGVFEDKATKNLFACEYVVNNMRHLKTVGIISEDPVTGITEIAEPIGVICGITPVTNPTSTVIFKSLICIKMCLDVN